MGGLNGSAVAEGIELVDRGALHGRHFGAYPAVVTDIVDPDGQGRVRVELVGSPDTDGSSYEAWARLTTLMAGDGRGTWFVPDVTDEVLVVFEGGDTRRPYVVGALWNGQDVPPEEMDGGGDNNIKQIRTRSGVQITIDDSSGQEKLTLETPGGQTVDLADPGTITVEDSNGNTVEMASAGVTVTSSAMVTINASTVEVKASMVTVDAGMAKFSGVVKAVTVIADSVVGNSYTPGAGNIW